LKTLTRKRAASPNAKPKSAAAAFARALDVFLGRDAAHQFFRVFRFERRAFDAMQNSVDADDRRDVRADVQVGRAFGHDQLQQSDIE